MDRADSTLTARLIEDLYVEAMLLADEARSLLPPCASARPEPGASLGGGVLAWSCESLKLTTRLMHIVAWLLARRALLAASPGQAPIIGRALGPADPPDPALVERLDPATRAVVEGSAELYRRIAHLAERLDAGGPGLHGARALQQRVLSRL